MNIINYFYTTKSNEKLPPPPPPLLTDFNTITQKKTQMQKTATVFLVLNKHSQMPLGVYDTLELAKKNGESATYHNCSIYRYTINNKCLFLNNPVFEST